PFETRGASSSRDRADAPTRTGCEPSPAPSRRRDRAGLYFRGRPGGPRSGRHSDTNGPPERTVHRAESVSGRVSLHVWKKTDQPLPDVYATDRWVEWCRPSSGPERSFHHY